MTRDGEVTGSAIGVIEERDGVTTARRGALREADGGPLRVKAEGIVMVGDTNATRVRVAVDMDAHDRPSELLEVELAGPWTSATSR